MKKILSACLLLSASSTLLLGAEEQFAGEKGTQRQLVENYFSAAPSTSAVKSEVLDENFWPNETLVQNKAIQTELISRGYEVLDDLYSSHGIVRQPSSDFLELVKQKEHLAFHTHELELLDRVSVIWALYHLADKRNEGFVRGSFSCKDVKDNSHPLYQYLLNYVLMVNNVSAEHELFSEKENMVWGNSYAYKRMSSHYKKHPVSQFGIDVRSIINKEILNLLPFGMQHILFAQVPTLNNEVKLFLKIEEHGNGTFHDMFAHLGDFSKAVENVESFRREKDMPRKHLQALSLAYELVKRQGVQGQEIELPESRETELNKAFELLKNTGNTIQSPGIEFNQSYHLLKKLLKAKNPQAIWQFDVIFSKIPSEDLELRTGNEVVLNLRGELEIRDDKWHNVVKKKDEEGEIVGEITDVYGENQNNTTFAQVEDDFSYITPLVPPLYPILLFIQGKIASQLPHNALPSTPIMQKLAQLPGDFKKMIDPFDMVLKKSPLDLFVSIKDASFFEDIGGTTEEVRGRLLSNIAGLLHLKELLTPNSQESKVFNQQLTNLLELSADTWAKNKFARGNQIAQIIKEAIQQEPSKYNLKENLKEEYLQKAREYIKKSTGLEAENAINRLTIYSLSRKLVAQCFSYIGYDDASTTLTSLSSLEKEIGKLGDVFIPYEELENSAFLRHTQPQTTLKWFSWW